MLLIFTEKHRANEKQITASSQNSWQEYFCINPVVYSTKNSLIFNKRFIFILHNKKFRIKHYETKNSNK